MCSFTVTPKPATYGEDLLENVAAISAEVWGDQSSYFYVRHGEALSGFPGVWKYTIEAARIFTDAEVRFGQKYGIKPEASYEYLDAILDFAGKIAKADELPTTEQLKQWADTALLTARN